MTNTNLTAKANAVLPLAQGLSRKEVAEQVGVAPSTVTAWLRNPAFAQEVAKVKAVIEVKPLDPDKVLAELQASHDRIRGGDRRPGVVTVSIPAGASPRRRQRLIGRAVAKALADDDA